MDKPVSPSPGPFKPCIPLTITSDRRRDGHHSENSTRVEEAGGWWGPAALPVGIRTPEEILSDLNLARYVFT